MSEISKVISKIYVWNDEFKCNTVVAEVVENPGLGFEYLIRIPKRFSKILDVWTKCLGLCNLITIGLDNSIIEKSISDGYYYTHEEIAVVIDEII